MENIEQIMQLLNMAGYSVLGYDDAYLYIRDPSCIVSAFFDLAKYAWIILCLVTVLLLFGWAVTFIRGANHKIFENLRDLILIFAIVSAAVPIVSAIWGDDIKTKACQVVSINRASLNEVLQASKDNNLEAPEYEIIDIRDSYNEGI